MVLFFIRLRVYNWAARHEVGPSLASYITGLYEITFVKLYGPTIVIYSLVYN